MAAAIPMVITFVQGAAAAGSLAAGVGAVMGAMAGSLGGFLTMAGGMMAGIGTLAGDKDLTKFGSVLTLAGGIGNLAAPSLFGKTGAAASAGAEAAQSTSEAASSVAEPAAQSANSSAALGKVSELNPLGQAAPAIGPGAPNPAGMGEFNMPDLDAGGSLWQRAVNPTVGNPLGEMSLGNPLGATAGDLASAASTSNTLAAGYNMPALATDPLQQAASSLTMQDVTNFLKNNKELVNLGGNALASMFGPQAEAIDFQKSLYERRRRNLNSPVRLGIVPGG